MNRSHMRSLRRLAEWLVKGAGSMLPSDRGEWARAMEAEVVAIPSDYEALRWAVGCCVATNLTQVRAHLRHPAAFVPLTLSLLAIGMVLIHAALYGIVASTDEGTPARIFQLLMVVQLPVVAIFAVRWWPTAPAATLQVMFLQVVAACCAIMSVLFLT